MIELNGSVTLVVDQAGLTLPGLVAIVCLTPRTRLRARSQMTPRACSIARPRSRWRRCDLNLTVAEYKQIADGDTTLSSGYYISDTADNIEMRYLPTALA